MEGRQGLKIIYMTCKQKTLHQKFVRELILQMNNDHIYRCSVQIEEDVEAVVSRDITTASSNLDKAPEPSFS